MGIAPRLPFDSTQLASVMAARFGGALATVTPRRSTRKYSAEEWAAKQAQAAQDRRLYRAARRQGPRSSAAGMKPLPWAQLAAPTNRRTPRHPRHLHAATKADS